MTKNPPNILEEIEPISLDSQGLIILDGSGLPLIVFDDMSEIEMADHLGNMTSLQLSALAGRLTVLANAVDRAIESKPRDPRPTQRKYSNGAVAA